MVAYVEARCTKVRKHKKQEEIVVPVLDRDNEALMPCKEKRARKLMEKGEAIPYWQHGKFCIKLLREPSARNYQDVALGIDPGSKREGYTVATKKAVVMNITTNTPSWVKGNVETRRTLRRSRRYRKTPYRACRENRAILRSSGRIPPSTRARWDAKLRIIKQLLRILPITHINVEDIKALTKKSKRKWNASFSPLEVGKAWFYAEVKKLVENLSTTEGHQTKEHRDKRLFEKSKDKLSYVWEAHNVDSHSLAEMALGVEVLPVRSLYQIDFLRFHRRALHTQNFATGGVRRDFGKTVSLDMSRGSVLRWRDNLVYLGGSSEGRVSVHSIATGKRLSQAVKMGDITVMYATKQRTQFLHQHEAGGFLAKRS